MCDCDFSYSLENGEVTLTSYNNTTATNVVIPETINGYPVNIIGATCFWGKSSITNIDFGDVVKVIGGAAFEGCVGLTEIYIP